MNGRIQKYVKDNSDLMYKTLKEMCLIPAPSHFEDDRAEYCKKWLEDMGARGVYIDEAKNVIFPINCENSNKITVLAAHTDTVFPDREPMPYYERDGKAFCPGVSDDTASVVVLMLCAKYFTENNILPENGIMFVCNSCEEGLGNLKGMRRLFKDLEGRVDTFISLDSTLKVIADRAVGSHRYSVEVRTEGGHSYGSFGNHNAINELSRIINEIYEIKVPERENTKTTYNVGTVEGGTSVNTIAQSAKMLCEYRSDDKDCLEYMQERFEEIFSRARERAEVNVELVGDRPCGNIDKEKLDALKKTVVPIMEEVLGEKVSFKSASTDCNIPMSLGIKTLCIGANDHGLVHTREEWVDKESMKTGLIATIKVSIALTEASL